MVNVDSYLRIYRWRGLSGKILLNGTPDPHETAVALIQLAALIRTHAPINTVIPQPLYRVLTEQVDERGVTYGAMCDPVARSLFLSDLHDFLRLFKLTHTSHNAAKFPHPQGEFPHKDKG